VFASGAGGQFLKLIPIIDDFVAASPSLFEIVEDGLPWVVVAGCFSILLFVIVFEAAMAFAPFVPFGLHFNYKLI
jgi:hypothetical protein